MRTRASAGHVDQHVLVVNTTLTGCGESVNIDLTNHLEVGISHHNGLAVVSGDILDENLTIFVERLLVEFERCLGDRQRAIVTTVGRRGRVIDRFTDTESRCIDRECHSLSSERIEVDSLATGVLTTDAEVDCNIVLGHCDVARHGHRHIDCLVHEREVGCVIGHLEPCVLDGDRLIR